MQKNIILNKITTTIIITSMSVLLFAGCSSSKTNASTANETTNSQARQIDGTAIKTLYSAVLKELVTANTITQAQSDKVLAVVNKDMPQGGGGDKPTGTPPGKTDDTTKGTPPATTDDTTKGTPPDGANDSQPKNDRLSELVTSKVITQAQADTINTKLNAAMGSNQPKASERN